MYLRADDDDDPDEITPGDFQVGAIANIDYRAPKKARRSYKGPKVRIGFHPPARAYVRRGEDD